MRPPDIHSLTVDLFLCDETEKSNAISLIFFVRFHTSFHFVCHAIALLSVLAARS